MHDFMEALHVTALGMGVVFVGLLVLTVAVLVSAIVVNSWKDTEAKRASPRVLSPVTSAMPRPPGVPPTGAAGMGVSTADAARLACVTSEPGAGEATSADILSSLVAAIAAVLVAHEEAGGGSPRRGG